jgi:hypothetical protein
VPTTCAFSNKVLWGAAAADGDGGASFVWWILFGLPLSARDREVEVGAKEGGGDNSKEF